TAQGLQDHPPLGDGQPVQVVDDEGGLAGGGGEAAFVPRRVGQDEPVGLPDAGVEVLEAGDHSGDGVADGVVVVREPGPGDGIGGSEQVLGELADDGHFAAQVC